MTRFNLYQGFAVLPLLLMVLLQEWIAAGAVLVTLIFVVITVLTASKERVEESIEIREDNPNTINAQAMLVSMLQQEIGRAHV